MIHAAADENTMKKRHSSSKKQRGAAMLEALVSVLILSLGVLSLVGLQGAMVRESTNAEYRAQASFLANRLVGQMWVDMTHMADYAIADGSCTSSNESCEGWLDDVQNQMPNGSATVAIDASNNVTVTINWSLPGRDANQYTMTATINS